MNTVRYDRFIGLDVNDHGVKHSIGEGGIWLSKATNVNITRKFGVERRDGFSLWKAGSYCSIWGNGSVCYAATTSGNLVSLNSSGTETLLKRGVTGSNIRFADAGNGTVYWSDGAGIGKITGTTESVLGTSSDQFKAPLPAGNMLCFHSPYLIVVKDKILYFSDPVNRDVYHKIQGFMQFKSNVRMVAAVGRTLFVSDSEDLWVLRSVKLPLEIARPMFRQDRARNYPAVKGDNVRLVYNVAVGDKFYSTAALFMTERGICIGGEEGGVDDLSDGKYNMPTVLETACAETLRSGDLNLYISVIKGV